MFYLDALSSGFWWRHKSSTNIIHSEIGWASLDWKKNITPHVIYEIKSFKSWETQDSRSNLNHLRRLFVACFQNSGFHMHIGSHVLVEGFPFCFVETNEAADRCSDYVHRVCRLMGAIHGRTIERSRQSETVGLRQIFDCASIDNVSCKDPGQTIENRYLKFILIWVLKFNHPCHGSCIWLEVWKEPGAGALECIKNGTGCPKK